MFLYGNICAYSILLIGLYVSVLVINNNTRQHQCSVPSHTSCLSHPNALQNVSHFRRLQLKPWLLQCDDLTDGSPSPPSRATPHGSSPARARAFLPLQLRRRRVAILRLFVVISGQQCLRQQRVRQQGETGGGAVRACARVPALRRLPSQTEGSLPALWSRDVQSTADHVTGFRLPLDSWIGLHLGAL